MMLERHRYIHSLYIGKLATVIYKLIYLTNCLQLLMYKLFFAVLLSRLLPKENLGAQLTFLGAQN